MTQYDNEFFRGPPEELPTLVTDQRPTGVEIFQAKPERATGAADVPVTREEAPKDPPKKKSNARRITKAIKLLASCMAAVVITEAAANIAATVEPIPEEIPTGQYYVGQWPGVEPSHGGVYRMDLEADMGYSIQVPLDDRVWRLTAGTDWRMCWYEGTDSGLPMAYFGLTNQETGVFLMADLTAEPHYTEYEEDCYTTLTTSTGETLYIRAFFMSMGQYGEEYGLSEEMLAASAELRQALVEEAFAGIRVTPGTEDGWQGFQIGDKIYSQQSEDWYGLGGFGDLEIHIPWVNYAEDYNLHNMTPYARETVNGITWSIYFAENDTYLWAVPNIDPEICLGGYVFRFMCADAVRRGEYINDDEWTGFTSASQRRTAVNILIECLQHHYALRERRYPRDWPWKGATDRGALWIWAESVKGTWTQFSFGDEAYRVNSTDPELRFYWEETRPLRDGMVAALEISRMIKNDEVYAINLAVCRTPFTYVAENCAYRTAQASGGETLYLEFRSQYYADGAEFTSAEMEPIADQILGSITFQSNPDDSGWCPLLLCDTMYSPANMEWSGCGIVGTNVAIFYIHPVESEGLNDESPIGTRTHNGITWTLYYDPGDEEWDSCIWAVPDIEPDVCIGFRVIYAESYYREKYTDLPTYGWEDGFQAAEAVSEALAYIYPLGVEPEAPVETVAKWPVITPRSDGGYDVDYLSRNGGTIQVSMGDAGYRISTSRGDIRMMWNRTTGYADEAGVEFEIRSTTENWGIGARLTRAPESYWTEEDPYCSLTTTDGETLYIVAYRYGLGDAADRLETLEDEKAFVLDIFQSLTVGPAVDGEWDCVQFGDKIYTQQSMTWSGTLSLNPISGYCVQLRAAHTADAGLDGLKPFAERTINGIQWSIYHCEYDGWEHIWAVPNVDPEICLGSELQAIVDKYHSEHETENRDWNITSDENLQYAAEELFVILESFYPQ